MSSKIFNPQDDLIEELLKRYRPVMRRIAEEILCDYYEADDVVQIALLKVIKNIEKIEDLDSKKCRNFIFVITKNAALDELRKKKQGNIPKDPIEFVNMVDGRSLIESDINEYFSETMKQFLNQLKEVDRDIITLRYGDGYDTKEIGELLEMTQGAVQKRLLRARKYLAHMMKQNGEEDHNENE